MDQQTLRDWVHRYNTSGIDGLQSRASPGRAPALSEDQRAALKALVIAGPDPVQDKVVRWRCADLREEVARRFNVVVHESTIGKWLHQLGLTRLQPCPFHPKKAAGSCPNAWCSSVPLVASWVGWAAASQAAPAGKLTGAASSMGASVSRVM